MENPASLSRDHALDEQVCEFRECHNVQLDHRLVSPPLALEKLSMASEAGVVDQKIDFKFLGLNRIEDSPGRVRLCQVRGNTIDANTVLAIQF